MPRFLRRKLPIRLRSRAYRRAAGIIRPRESIDELARNDVDLTLPASDTRSAAQFKRLFGLEDFSHLKRFAHRHRPNFGKSHSPSRPASCTSDNSSRAPGYTQLSRSGAVLDYGEVTRNDISPDVIRIRFARLAVGGALRFKKTVIKFSMVRHQHRSSEFGCGFGHLF